MEVDFIVYGPKGLYAFEIKRASTITSKSLRGLKQFQEDYPQAKLYLVYTGQHQEYRENITLLPIEQALRELPNILNSG